MRVRLQAALVYHMTVQAPLKLERRRTACSNNSDNMIVQTPQTMEVGSFSMHVRLQHACMDASIDHRIVQAPLQFVGVRKACSKSKDHLNAHAPQQVGVLNSHVRLQSA